jgi:adenosylcobinamide-GDP ribazoletransferase
VTEPAGPDDPGDPGGRDAPGGSGRAGGSGWGSGWPWSGARTALALFTAIPVADAAELGEGDAVRAILWLPAVGLLLGGTGAAVVVGLGEVNPSAAGRLLGAAVAVAVIAGLTGALHLDGLADTADGLGSRRPSKVALEIMRRPDIGPMGVAALMFVLLIQVTAIAAVPRGPIAGGALALAEVTGRVSVVLATASPAARPGGFGALIAGRTTRRARILTLAGLALLVAAGGLLAGGFTVMAAALGACGAGLTAGWLLRRVTERRLGGMTGDVFGAILVVSATATLLAAALLG